MVVEMMPTITVQSEGRQRQGIKRGWHVCRHRLKGDDEEEDEGGR